MVASDWSVSELVFKPVVVTVGANVPSTVSGLLPVLTVPVPVSVAPLSTWTPAAEFKTAAALRMTVLVEVSSAGVPDVMVTGSLL